MNPPILFETKISSKTTTQRNIQESLETLIKSLPRGSHLTAPEVFQLAQQNNLKVSLSSVYRTLKHLAQHGHIQALTGEHGRRYESSEGGQEHDHLICVKCNLTIEFEDSLIAGFGRSLADRKAYEYHHSRFDILGICKECKSKSEESKYEIVSDMLKETISQIEQVLKNLEQSQNLLNSRKIQTCPEILSKTESLMEESKNQITNCMLVINNKTNYA